MPPPVLAPGQPIPATAYPFAVTITPVSWPLDADGAPAQGDGSPATLACDVQAANPSNPVRLVDGEFPHGLATANFVFAARPSVAIATDTPMSLVSGPGGAYATPQEWRASGPAWDRGSGLWAVTATRRA